MKKDCVSLQVHKPNKKIKESLKNLLYYPNKKIRKRVCLFTSENNVNSGSITIEALLSLTVFMLVVLFMCSFLLVINTEMSMQINIDNATRSAGKTMFYLDELRDIADKSDTLKSFKDKFQKKLSEIMNKDGVDRLLENWNVDNKTLSELLNVKGKADDVIDRGYLLTKLIQNTGTDAIKGEGFVSKIEDLKVIEGEIDDGMVRFAIKYKMKLPMVNRYITIVQGSYVKDWTGTDISSKSEKVYITENGEVYHSSLDCSYLVVNISKTTVEVARENYNGNKYSACRICVKNKLEDGESVFVTEDGNRYHTSLTCRGLKRKIIEMDIEQVDERRPCSKCW